MKISIVSSLLTVSFWLTGAYAHNGHEGHILADKNKATHASFDIVHAKVTTLGSYVVFQQKVRGKVGKSQPEPVETLAAASVYSYVWPTNLDTATVGFDQRQGILALALTIHPDFDDTPLYDEDGDGNKSNDGDKWHSHWVVLVPDDACGQGALKVKDIEPGTEPILPITWPELPIFIDSPGYQHEFTKKQVLVSVPLKELGFQQNFSFDGVTAGLKVNANLHAPLLCVVDVFDVASGDLSLPGVSQ